MDICEAMAIELPGYVEGKLDPGTEAIVKQHLEGCAACRVEVRELERLNALLAQALPRITPSPAFAARFAERLAAEVAAEDCGEAPAERRWLTWLLQPSWIPLAAAAALGVIMFTPWFNGSRVEKAPLSPPHPVGGPVASAGSPFPATGVASAPGSGARPITATAPAGESRIAAVDVPADLLGRADLFVDFDVIRDLDLLESKGSTKVRRGGEAG